MIGRPFPNQLILWPFLFFSALGSSPARAVPTCNSVFDTHIEEWKSREQNQMNTFAKDPARMFTEDYELILRTSTPEQIRTKEFSYKRLEPSLQRALGDIQKRLHDGLPEGVPAGTSSKLSALESRAEDLLARNCPYASSIYFIFDYVEALDEIFLIHHPHLANEFHRPHSRQALPRIIEQAPVTFLLPTFEDVNVGFFADTRSAPIYIVGINLSGMDGKSPAPFADGFWMKPSEFAYHDIGHIEFMAMRDTNYILSASKNVITIVQEWDYTRRRIKKFTDSFRKNGRKNKNLRDAMELLLFEILHERSYQYSLGVLKTQLETGQFVEIIRRKLENGYYRTFQDMNFEAFDSLDEARHLLLDYITRLKTEDQLHYYETFKAGEIDRQFTYYPPAEEGWGNLKGLEINPDGQILANMSPTQGGNKKLILPTDQLILAQTAPARAEANPFSSNRNLKLRKINALIAASPGGQGIHWNHEKVTFETLLISRNGKMQVRISRNDGSKVEIEILDPNLTVDDPFWEQIDEGQKNEVVNDRQLFEIEQALGASDLGKPIFYVRVHKPIIYRGRATLGMSLGKPVFFVSYQEVGGGKKRVALPVPEVLIDPIPKETP